MSYDLNSHLFSIWARCYLCVICLWSIHRTMLLIKLIISNSFWYGCSALRSGRKVFRIYVRKDLFDSVFFPVRYSFSLYICVLFCVQIISFCCTYIKENDEKNFLCVSPLVFGLYGSLMM